MYVFTGAPEKIFVILQFACVPATTAARDRSFVWIPFRGVGSCDVSCVVSTSSLYVILAESAHVYAFPFRPGRTSAGGPGIALNLVWESLKRINGIRGTSWNSDFVFGLGREFYMGLLAGQPNISLAALRKVDKCT